MTLAELLAWAIRNAYWLWIPIGILVITSSLGGRK